MLHLEKPIDRDWPDLETLTGDVIGFLELSYFGYDIIIVDEVKQPPSIVNYYVKMKDGREFREQLRLG